MKIRLVKSDGQSNVRLNKYFKFFTENNIQFDFIGWQREKENHSPFKDNFIPLITGGGYGGKKLIFYYLLWIMKLFLYHIFLKDLSKYKFIVINFDSGFVLYLISLIRKVDFIYEIRDDFSLSYNFPKWIKVIIDYLDNKIKSQSSNIIHVDENRVLSSDKRVIIIENSPFDFFKGKEFDKELKHCFAITGNISEIRGAHSILKFARKNKHVDFILAGKFYDSYLKSSFLSLGNVTYYDYMPQDKLFNLLSSCCGIFSIYDPILEINKKAASNKLYDAMMLSIPVITNIEVINSKVVIDNVSGYIVDYEFNNTWDFLASKEFINDALCKGKNGRKLYEEKYEFNKLLKTQLLPILQNETNYTRS